MRVGSYEIVQPEYLYLLFLVPLFLTWFLLKRKMTSPYLMYSALPPIFLKKGWMDWAPFALPILKIFTFIFFVIALSRPRKVEDHLIQKSIQGIDIVLTVDISASMLAQDLKPNRLEALKKVAKQFIYNRPTDRIALVSYAGEAFSSVPLTLDKFIITRSLEELQFGWLEDGTAIGVGLANALKRLENSTAKSKVVILLTDGENNRGFINPTTAAEIAQKMGVKVYTIGIGTRGMARTPYAYDASGRLLFRMMPSNLDENLLSDIAKKTGGMYFRATDNENLKKIYQDIDQLERTKIDEKRYFSYEEYFYLFIAAGLFTLVLETLLRHTFFSSLAGE